jgi:glycosyltransferase involved in cell wall biosynthesis
LKTDVLLFSPYTGGHHPEYLHHLVDGWRKRSSGSLRVVCALSLLDQHPRLLGNPGDASISFEPITEAQALYESGTSLWKIALWHRKTLKLLSEKHRPRHIFLPFLDHMQPALAARIRLHGDPGISGILFRPETHYRSLGRHEAGESVARGIKKRLLMRQALRHPYLRAVFSLDPTAVSSLSRYTTHASVIHLGDPVPRQNPTRDRQETLGSIGAPPSRRCGLLFGALAHRKGVLELLRAATLLPADLAETLTLVLAGRLDSSIATSVHELVRTAEEAGIFVVLIDEVLDDQDLANLVHAADVILMPYLRHVGSSGALVRAAAARRPVIAQRYGLIGHLVEQHRLGICCDPTDPESLRAALARFLTGGIPFDPAAAKDYASKNTVEAFQETIWRHILSPP